MVEDPYQFGQIAATNALSDVYAMGGKPITAMNILAYPEEGDKETLAQIIRGGASKVKEADCVLAGGHSIDDPIPKYGLSVTGIVHPDRIIKNNSTREGDIIIMTKPIGSGIITTAYSVEETDREAYDEAVKWMTTLNKYAAEIMVKYDVSSATDITGFGLLGHLDEMLTDELSAHLYADQVIYIEDAYRCAKEFITTAGGQKNRNFLAGKVEFAIDDYAMEELLLDPQTSGGLLMAVNPEDAEAMIQELEENQVDCAIIGEIVPRSDCPIIVLNK